ncbi:PQQ-binding-like beta-propeller repeat protein [Streptomyces sp. NPDC004539]|uniref:protein kinase domain-containing protein n=1 Tax=Streptomyces sp. NPDC004539 TaxID=3154280 RepID=UPI0033ABAF81
MTPLSTGDPESIGGYTLLGRLGAGGMGVVYLGVSASGRQVAVKLVRGAYAEEEEFRTRFRQEIAAARRVSGAFTAPVVDADPDAERPWMATLYVPGLNLAEVVQKEGPLGLKGLRALGLGLTEALRDIHRVGLVHRDLKPGNVLMTEDGPRVIDFGISRAEDHQSLTTTGRMIGTPPFMSPEQMASPRDVTPASDVFSLGSLLVYAAVGAGPFDSDSPYITGYQVAFGVPDLAGVPDPLLGIVERCLDKDPAARPELTVVQRVLQELPETGSDDRPTVPGGRRAASPAAVTAVTAVTAPTRTTPAAATPTSATPAVPPPTTTAPEPPGSASRRRRLLLIALAAALAVTGLSVGLGLTLSEPEPDAPTPGPTTRTASLPAGWKPWQVALRYDVKGIPLDYNTPGCVTKDNALYCGGTGFTAARLDAATGRTLWREGTRPQGVRPIGVRDGLVYTYEEPDDSVRRLVALDTTTGERSWQHDISRSEPAVPYGAGLLTLSPDHSEFVAYGPSGKELWRAPSLDDYCTPSVLGDVPYVLCEQGTEPGQAPVELMTVAADSLTSLATLPQKSLALGAVEGRPLFLAPQTTKDVYEAGYERPYNALLSVDPETGKVTRVPFARALTGAATLVDGVVYFARSDGTVTAVSAADGRQLWQKVTDVENLSAPVVSAAYRRVYFANRFGRLLALDSRTGAEVWRTSALDDPGDKTENHPPQVLLVGDAIVATAGDTAFSRSPDGPK